MAVTGCVVAFVIVLSGCLPCRSAGGQCGVVSAPGVETASTLPTLNTAGLKVLLDSGASLTLLDARYGKYDDGRRIPGAKSLNAKSTASQIAAVIPSKESLVVTYCSNQKCPASNMLAEHLGELGYKNVIEYPYGIAGWADAGNKVNKAK